MNILHQRLLESLKNLHRQFPHQRGLVVGFSGGLDSTVLLEACVQTRQHWSAWFVDGLRAIHVHHGLSGNADDWLGHCQQYCEQRQVPLEAVRVRLHAGLGVAVTGAVSGAVRDAMAIDVSSQAVSEAGNIEKRARDARYQAFRQHVQASDMLLLAHHQDDQAETVLLRLLRGSGERGLAGMPDTRMLVGQVPLHRPWLTTPRLELEVYAAERQLTWVDDESNVDERFDRNFLRQRLLPLIAQRWPGWRDTVTRSARHSAQASALLAEQTDVYLQRWLEQAGDDQAWFSRLPCEPLLALSTRWQQRVVRAWLHDQVGQWPDEDTTQRCWRLFAGECVTGDDSQAEQQPREADAAGKGDRAGDGSDSADSGESRADSAPSTLITLRAVDGDPAPINSHVKWPQQHWSGLIFRRYRGHVYACPPDVVPPPIPGSGLSWQAGPDGRFPVLMLPGNGSLRWYLVNGGGMRRPQESCEVRYRQGGEQAALAGRPRRTLKKILQEAGIVPWQRDRVPLIYVDGELAWIGGVGVCEGYQINSGESGWALRWQNVVPPRD